jgi:hypothetical protein
MQDWPEKRLHFRGLFISSAVTAWKANPRRPLRHGAAPVPTTYRPKARKPVRGAKEWHTGAKDGQRVERDQRRAEANQFHRRAIPTKIGQNPYALLISAGRRGSNAYGR